MTNIHALQIAVNVITAEIFLLFCVSLIILNKTKSMSQRAFIAWILSLAVLGMTGAAWLSTQSSDTAFLLAKTHYSILLTSAVVLWIFATCFRRDILGKDTVYLLPALIIYPIVWTLMLTGVEYKSTGWEPLSTFWFEIYFSVLFGYYIAAETHLIKSYFDVKKTGDRLSLKRLRIITVSVLALILIGAAIPVASRVFGSPFLTLVMNFCYMFPPLFMAWSFQINDRNPRS